MSGLPDSPVRVRFAPSPTGHLHVGGARTALFNWLYARHHRGVFILRIEDTDLERSTVENIDSILEALEWLGLDWDEGPPAPGYRQTERVAIYREHAEQLFRAGRAYYCDCSRTVLEQEREAAQRRGETFRYSGRCRERDLRAGVLRLRIPAEGATVVNDLIHGSVTFEHSQLDDWILVRTEGAPTYNFCVVVDDVTMGITHVIRGNDHLSNTPKQILCYEALDYPVPEFAHVSMILGPDRSRLSKRHGATSVQAFRDEGILADAMVNYLARLGWSHGDQEIFSRAELIELFDIKDVAASAAVFDRTKLEWLSHEHLKRMDAASLARAAVPFIEQEGAAEGVEIRIADHAWLGRVVDTLKERAKTLVELARLSVFYFKRPGYTYEATHKYFTAEGVRRLDGLMRELEALTEFQAGPIESVYRRLTAELGLRLVDLAQLTRVAVTGRTASPPLFEVLELLGKAETLERLRAAGAFGAGALREP